jgi:hypothetical protein
VRQRLAAETGRGAAREIALAHVPLTEASPAGCAQDRCVSSESSSVTGVQRLSLGLVIDNALWTAGTMAADGQLTQLDLCSTNFELSRSTGQLSNAKKV